MRAFVGMMSAAAITVLVASSMFTGFTLAGLFNSWFLVPGLLGVVIGWGVLDRIIRGDWDE